MGASLGCQMGSWDEEKAPVGAMTPSLAAVRAADFHLDGKSTGTCPVSGATGRSSGRCPAVSFALPDEAGGHSDYIHVNDLPEATLAELSEEMKADLEEIKVWPRRDPLSPEDIVVVKGAWNRTIAWKDAMMEAMVYRWMHMDPSIYSLLQSKFDELPHDMFQLIDRSVRALDKRTEVHHRESYQPGFPACVTRDYGGMPSDIIAYYTIIGVRPRHWALLKEAFLFAMKTHNPYCYKEHDGADLELGEEGAISRFFHLHVVKKTHAAFQKLIDTMQSPDALIMARQSKALVTMPEILHEFYHMLLTNHSELCDFFQNSDMDHLAHHFLGMLQMIGQAGVRLRDKLAMLSELSHKHRMAMIPVEAYTKMSTVLLMTLRAHLEVPESVGSLWYFAFMSTASVLSAPMAAEERLFADAEEFFVQLAKEEGWSTSRLDARLSQIRTEIGICGTYRHTAEEICFGTRLAWRNAPKCIGRIAWDSLQLRDCRHVASAGQAFQECREHLKAAAVGGVITPTMTVFAPRKPNQRWGVRYWNSQFCRYAGYRQEDGSVLGDPSNADFTEMVMKRFGWKPPSPRGRFDPLPQVMQFPGQNPEICEFDRELFAEIPIVHPTYPKFAELGLLWTSIPAITNFNINLGGVQYPCIPFNGWFVELEIARNLVERYDVGLEVAAACGIDASRDSNGWRARVLHTVSEAVTHSFQQKKYSIVDHYTVSKQFLTHVDREKQCGREVPAQWSWIGGFAGVHCPVWHYEMRDFYLRPQYQYQCDPWVVEDDVTLEERASSKSVGLSTAEDDPREVLILYASTTGTAQHFARTMAKELGLGYRPRVAELNAVSEDLVRRYTHILCFVSTFADGEGPANGREFKLPKRLSSAKTTKIRYAVMACGSSLYPNFCAFGKCVDKAFEDAGCDKFVTTILADECGNQVADFRKFLVGVRNELGHRDAPEDAATPVLEISLGEVVGATPEPSEINGHRRAKVVRAEVQKGQRTVRHLSIDIGECEGLRYATGGHISILPCNPDVEVASLASVFGINKEQLHANVEATMVEGKLKYPASYGFLPSTLYNVLRWHMDITVRASSVPRIMSMVHDAGGMSVDEYASIMGEDSGEVAARYWWVSNVLRAFPKAMEKLTLGTLLSTLAYQAPRLYSIVSSDLVSPSVIDVCVGLVSVDINDGLSSGYLHSVEVGSSLWVSAGKSSFVPPKSLSTPMIMVAAGTGTAPFAAFVRQRMHLGAKDCGDAMLFCGARSKADVLLEPVFREALEAKALTAYSIALSREPGQERRRLNMEMQDSAAAVWELLQRPDCEYYMCGDAGVADDAYEALLQVVMSEGHMSRARSIAFMSNMRSQGRYHLDIWGSITHGQRVQRSSQRKKSGAKAWLEMVKVKTAEPSPEAVAGA